MKVARKHRRHAGLLVVALLLVGDLSAAVASPVDAARRWSHSATSPHATRGRPASLPAPTTSPHPAVARVVVPERNGTSYGSGTLVDVRGDYGLVLTNWHVVRDAAGTIDVLFPDGFRSAARALKVDRNWDLAALVIWRPPIAPVSLALAPPQPGDPLTIAGYGRGWYRMAAGRCTQYVAPGRDQPYEMVEVGVTARQGDSGGPIFNQQGKLAGVLFGSGGGTTTGAYCGRVGGFLADLGPDVGRGLHQAVARATPRTEPNAVATRPAPEPNNANVASKPPLDGTINDVVIGPAPRGIPAARLADNPPSRTHLPPPAKPPTSPQAATVTAVTAGPLSPAEAAAAACDPTGQSPFDQAKTALAVIGGISLLLLAARAIRV